MMYFECLVLFLTNVAFQSILADMEYPLVGFEDYPPNFQTGTQKTYTTQLGLIPIREDVTFDETTFYESVNPYYADVTGLIGLKGYVTLNIETVREETDLTLVTYDVKYDYAQLLTSSEISDDKIRNTIGNYQHVVNGIKLQSYQSWERESKAYEDFFPPLDDTSVVVIEDTFNSNFFETGSGSPITQDYYFPDTDQFFQFAGRSLCSDSISLCNSTHTTCTETLDGVSASCVSQCKTEYCLNRGECKQENRYVEPECLCPSQRATWYVGERCETRVEEWMGILLIIVACLLFVAVCCLTIVVVLLMRKKYSKLHSGDEEFFKHKTKKHGGYSPDLYQKYKEAIKETPHDVTKVDLEPENSKSASPSFSSIDSSLENHTRKQSEDEPRYRSSRRGRRVTKAHRSRKVSNATKVYLMLQERQAEEDLQQREKPKRRLSNATKVCMMLKEQNMNLQNQTSISNSSNKTSQKRLSEKHSRRSKSSSRFESSKPPNGLKHASSKWLPVQSNEPGFDFQFKPTIFENFGIRNTPSPLPEWFSEEENQQRDTTDHTFIPPIPSSYWKNLEKSNSKRTDSETTV